MKKVISILLVLFHVSMLFADVIIFKNGKFNHARKFYCKFYWKKGKCRIPNKSVYRFVPTRGVKGNKEKLINMLKLGLLI